MKLDEAQQILTENGFLMEGLDYYMKFYNDVWDKIENDSYFTEYSDYYNDALINAVNNQIDNLIQKYYNKSIDQDVDECIEFIKEELDK